MKRRGPQRWRARGGAIVAPDPRAMLALATPPRLRLGVAIGVVLSCALHVAAVAWVMRTTALPPAEVELLTITLLREPGPPPAAVVPAPIVPPPPVAKPVPPRVVPKPARVAPPRVSEIPAPVAEPAPAATDFGPATPAVSAAPPSATVTGQGGGDPIKSYIASVLRRIESNKRYPTLARSRGVEGTVVVTLWISPAGGLERVEVGGEAPPLLVSSTRDAVERASPFPPPPSGMPSIRVPIRYALR